MTTTYLVLLVIHILLVFAVGLWLLAMGGNEIKKIPKGFLSLTIVTMILSLAMMQVNLMQHNKDSNIYLLDPYKYGVKTAVFAVLIAIVFKYYKKPSISQKVWQLMIALMAFDLLITGLWM
jgi:hypothetical protein